MSYYKKIKGKNYDRDIIEAADIAVTGKGDGRISLSDAKKILKLVKDGNTYTDIEKRSMQYIRDNYKFTPESDSWFRTEIRKWAAAKSPEMQEKTPVKKQAPKPEHKTAAKITSSAATKKRATSTPAADPVGQEAGYQIEPGSSVPDKTGRGWTGFFILGILAFVLIMIFVSPCGRNIFERGGSPEPETGSVRIQSPESLSDKAEVPVAVPSADEEGTYVVQPQDSLISISERLTGDYKNWEQIYNLNKNEIVRPSMIFAGQKLKLPENIKKDK